MPSPTSLSLWETLKTLDPLEMDISNWNRIINQWVIKKWKHQACVFCCAVLELNGNIFFYVFYVVVTIKTWRNHLTLALMILFFFFLSVSFRSPETSLYSLFERILSVFACFKVFLENISRIGKLFEEHLLISLSCYVSYVTHKFPFKINSRKINVTHSLPITDLNQR